LKINEFPYVFGGDGASFLVDAKSVEAVKSELLKVKKTAIKRFSMNLRVGFIKILEISAKGSSIKVAKFELSNGKFIAKFSGGGLTLADKLIKESEDYQVNNFTEGEADFKSLSCRWEPIQNQNGTILTLIIYSLNFESYSQIFKDLDKIFDFNQKKLNPVKTEHMKYKGFFEMLRDESKFGPGYFSLSYLKRFFEIILCYVFFNKLKVLSPKNLKTYTKSMERYSDFRKFDDSLRMVVDCSFEQKELAEAYLRSRDDLQFGVSTSETAIMTCLVKSINDGGHIHFIDGAGGGYSAASKMLKGL
jgi:hypothetical protein